MQVQKISELTNNGEKPTYDILSIHHNSEVNYNKLKEYFEDQMMKLKNSCYKMIEELKKITDMIKLEYLNIVEKKINRIWKDWQTNVMDRFAQLNYGYAITVHKSQGSTFKNVFIDIMDIFENHNQTERLKCLYTAITRSSNSLELLV
jgi:superfamily I DNA/RNA helicase